MGIAVRLGAIMALCMVVGLFVWAPWKGPDSHAVSAQLGAGDLVGADGTPLSDDGSFQPIPGFDNAPPHELIRYQMPPAENTPPLREGVTELTFSDLWADGSLEINEPETRLGSPGQSEFPDGTTVEDVMLFFLDLKDMRSLQPSEGAIRADLDGKRVRLAGYTTPVGFAEGDQRFLLVPVLGACIHVPPPPANQIVYVEEVEGTAEMFEPIWVTGTLRAEPVATVLADVGYRLENVIAEPYH